MAIFATIDKMKNISKLLALTAIVFFLGTMFFSLFHMSMGMDMSGGMSDCPFMTHEEVICPMDFADHLGTWKSVFLAVVPTLVILLVIVSVAVPIASIAPNLLRRIQSASPPQSRWLKARTYTFFYRSLQELFSNGILNPKLF